MIQKLTYSFLVLICFTSCSGQESVTSRHATIETILDQNFLAIADTLAYQYYALIPAPNDEKKPIKNKGEYIICVADSIASVTNLVSSMKTTNIYSSLTENFKTLLEQYDKKLFTSVDIVKIRNTGLYILKPQKACNEANSNVVGQMQFYQLVSDLKNAILFVTISDKIKSGRTCAYLLTNEKDKWVIQQKFTLEVW